MNTHLRRAVYFSLTGILLLSLFSCRRHRNPSFSSCAIPASARATTQCAYPETDTGKREKSLKTVAVRRYDLRRIASVQQASAKGTFDESAGMSARDARVAVVASTVTASHSETIVQEKGSGGGDLAKTDGKYIYLARGTRFFILTTEPKEDSAILSDTDLMEQISELYVSGRKVVLITSPVTIYPIGDGILSSVTIIPYRPVTRLYVYDVSAPDMPLLTASFDFPGYARASQHNTSSLYPVTNRAVERPATALP